MNERWNRLYADAAFFPTLAWNILLGRVLKTRNWWDVVDENVVLGALPFASDVPRLADIGVEAVVNTCAEYKGPVAEYEKCHIEQFRIPTVDYTPPTLESLELAVNFMDLKIEEGKRVYVHCKAGRGRSATVVACWLIRNRGMSASQAQEKMILARPHVNPRIAERAVVQQFERQCSRQQAASASNDF